MALQNPFHVPNTLGKSVTGAAPKPLPNPWHIPNAHGQDITGTPPAYPVNPTVAAPAAAPAAPAQIDFSTLVGSDPQYIREQAAIKQQNDLAVAQLAKQFATTRQSYQDNANAHGALFSGAAVHAQNYAGQNYADQGAQQALNYGTSAGTSLSNAWQRILNQFGGVA